MASNKKIWATLSYIFASLFLLYEMSLQVSPSIMTKQLMKDFSLTATTLGLMSSFYFYSYSIMQIPVGLLFDRFNAKILIAIATLICVAGAFFFAEADTFTFASLGRFFMGFGSAFAFVGVLTIANRWFAPKHFAFLVGMAQFLAAAGAWGGAYPLALWLENSGWRPMIFILATIGVGLMLTSIFFIKDHPQGTRVKKPVHHLLKELKVLLKNFQVYLLFIYAFCMWGPVTVLPALWAPSYLQARFHVSDAQAAFSSGMIWFGIALSAPILGLLSDRLKRRKPFIVIPSIIGLISSLVLLYMPNLEFGTTHLLFFLIGIAAAAQILSFAIGREINNPSVVSTGIGLNNMGVVLGGAILQPVVGKIIQYTSHNSIVVQGVPVYAVSDYTWGLSVVPICFLVGVIVACMIKETYCKPVWSKN
ncbi:MFS transporter [Candidatus Aerophobetes bacterium]|uniref:Lysosomal dipeptide transporter MFSD1 n=1 Tax=Aerophobetes bacterium TaxID=2030807 RepID=A0A2A4X4R6_UNCAE|nr:MAG: MFS transporter [Candidatus Aerophobetes bacterium]